MKKEINLSQKEIKDINKEKNNYEDKHSILVESLKTVQKHRGWISDEDIISISKFLSIPSSDIEGIATFYSHIFRKPVGCNIIRYCDSAVCYINGYKKNEIELKKLLNVKIGETTFDKKFTILPTCCLGNCDKSPVIMVNDDTYIKVRPKNIASILEKYK